MALFAAGSQYGSNQMGYQYYAPGKNDHSTPDVIVPASQEGSLFVQLFIMMKLL